MDSLTKIKLQGGEMEHLLKNAFGEKITLNAVDEMKDGWFNTIYSIRFDGAKEIVLKISPPPHVKTLRYEKDIMSAEVAVLRMLKEKTNIPVPEVYYYDATCTILNHEYFIMEKIKGESYSKAKKSLTDSEKEQVESKLGAYNRTINEIVGERFGYFSQPDTRRDRWSEAFDVMVTDILHDGRDCGVKLPMDYDKLYHMISDQYKFLDLVTQPRLVHWDLHNGNVLIDQNCNITGLLDCDRALWGDPLIEVYFSSLIDHSNFIKGYGSEILQSDGVKCRRVLYNTYLFLIMVVECSYRGFDKDHEMRAVQKLQDEINILKTL